MGSDQTVFNEWHPVLALADQQLGVEINTQLVGKNITFINDGNGYIAHETHANEKIRTLPVMQKYGMLWVSLSESPTDLFDIPEFLESDRRIVSAGSLRVDVSGLRAVENFLDMAHFPFVHTDILGAEPLTDVSPYTVSIDEENDEIFAKECRFAQPKAAATATNPIETDYIYRVVRPYVAILYKTCPPDPARWDVLCLFVQPATEESCIVHTIMCYIDEDNTDGQLRHFQQTIFGQDLMILVNQVPKRLPLSPRSETPVAADVLSTTYRRWLREKKISYGAIEDREAEHA